MKKKILILITIIIVIWFGMGIADFNNVSRQFEKPIFCVLVNGADDGGSGNYIGLGYSFEIEGNFMPEDEFPGVTKYKAKIFGIVVKTGIRD